MTGPGPRGRASQRLPIVLAAGLVLAACGTGAATPAPPTPAAAPTPTPLAQSPGPEPSVDGSLPTAFADGAGGVRVEGTLGSYTFDGQGGDAPWLPFDGLNLLTLGPGASIEVAFGDGSAVAGWRAQAAPVEPGNGPILTLAEGDTGPVRVGPMPYGEYVLAVAMTRADGRGDGIFYWAVVSSE